MTEQRVPLPDCLQYIQKKLKAPKSQVNEDGGFNYRNCEDILTAVKPLLDDVKCCITISDEVVEIAGRVYIRATAMIFNSNSSGSISSTAYAREPLEKKKMDDAQITGSSSSYARKYALNGLLAIDDTKDPDHPEPISNGTRSPNGAGQTTGPSEKQMKLIEKLVKEGRIADRPGLDNISAKEAYELINQAFKK